MGIIPSQPAVKGIKGYCCKIVTLNFYYMYMKQLICSLTHCLPRSPVYNLNLNVHTNRCTALSSHNILQLCSQCFLQQTYFKLHVQYKYHSKKTQYEVS